MKYRKKPMIVDAIQYLGFAVNGRECEVFLGDEFNSHIPTRDLIELMNGVTCSAGSWIVRGYGNNAATVWTSGAFEATFEAVE